MKQFASLVNKVVLLIISVLSVLGFPRDITFAEISCVGARTGLDALRDKIREKIDG